MRRSEIGDAIREAIENLGVNASANEILGHLAALEGSKIPSKPMVYKVLKEERAKAEKAKEDQEESFSPKEIEEARKFVQSVGSWKRAMRLVEVLRPLPE